MLPLVWWGGLGCCCLSVCGSRDRSMCMMGVGVIIMTSRSRVRFVWCAGWGWRRRLVASRMVAACGLRGRLAVGMLLLRSSSLVGYSHHTRAIGGDRRCLGQQPTVPDPDRFQHPHAAPTLRRRHHHFRMVAVDAVNFDSTRPRTLPIPLSHHLQPTTGVGYYHTIQSIAQSHPLNPFHTIPHRPISINQSTPHASAALVASKAPRSLLAPLYRIA